MRQKFVKNAGDNMLLSRGKQSVILIGPPDDVRLPPKLGGHVEDVVDHFMGPCPHCQKSVRHLVLKTINVAECDQFYWYRLK